VIDVDVCPCVGTEFGSFWEDKPCVIYMSHNYVFASVLGTQNFSISLEEFFVEADKTNTTLHFFFIIYL